MEEESTGYRDSTFGATAGIHPLKEQASIVITVDRLWSYLGDNTQVILRVDGANRIITVKVPTVNTITITMCYTLF